MKNKNQQDLQIKKHSQIKQSRRRFLLNSSLALGSLPLQSLVTGLPVHFLSSLGQQAQALDVNAKILIISHLQGADPINTNVPGTYPAIAGDTSDPLSLIEHPKVSELGEQAVGFENPVQFSLGETNALAASPWASLPETLRARMGFWHHGTFTNAHPDFPSVRRFNGAVKGQGGIGTDEFDALITQQNANALSTTLNEPLSVGGTAIENEGSNVPVIKPNDIKGVFSGAINNIEQMIQLRDAYVDRTYSAIKAQGTPAQQTFMDRYTQSQTQAKNIGDQLSALLTDINGNDAINQAKAAVALAQINLSPVITMGIPFGGDNHADSNLQDEFNETTSAIEAITTLWEGLVTAGIQDKVVFASLNTFGRTLRRNNSGGRDHNGNHHCLVTFGSNIKGGVVGGLEPYYKRDEIVDFKATSIASTTGESDNNGDITLEQSLVSVGKTLAKATGISDSVIETRLDGGKIIEGALT